MSFFQMILFPFSWLLNVFYSFTGSYGLALILFAIVVKVILFPFSLKGKRSMIQMNMLSGQMQKLQKQYGRDRERYNMEVQKLYEREKVNPMGGCLWSFIPLLILLPLYTIVRRPLYYIMGLTTDQISQIAQAVDWNTVAVDMGWIKSATDTFSSGGYNELFLSSLINENNITALRDFVQAVEEDQEVDVVLFDCPPGFTAASTAALMAAQEVIIPVLMDGFSLEGMAEMLAQVSSIRSSNPSLKVGGVLINQWHRSVPVVQAEQVLRAMPVPVYKQTIRRSDKVLESTMVKEAVADYSVTSAAARDYRLLAQEIFGEVSQYGQV